MSTWERLAELPVEIAEYALEPLQADVSSSFQRKSTVIRLRGAGEEGIGEDVTYEAGDHEILQSAGLSLFPQAPHREVSANYRTWAYESAALDLALRQARTTLHATLGMDPQP